MSGTTQAAFFSHARTLRSALSIEPPVVLLKKFSAGTTVVRATILLVRAALAVSDRVLARPLVMQGLELEMTEPPRRASKDSFVAGRMKRRFQAHNAR